MFGALINSTIYRYGKSVRKAALFVTFGHLFGQISYHVNLDQYFDSVFGVFE
jgi:predicted membrane protein